MKLTDLPIGAELIIDIERSGLYFTLKSKVSNIKGEGIVLHPPFNKTGQIQEVQYRDIIVIRFMKHGKIFQWDISNKEMIEENGMEFLYLETIHEVKNGNRRGAYRVSLSSKVAIRNIHKLNEINVRSRDLSQTGYSFYSSFILSKGELYDLEIKDDDFSIPLRLKIIRITEENNTYVYGSSIIKSDQLLRKYVTKKQIEQIRILNT